jgi:hypothetical protein
MPDQFRSTRPRRGVLLAALPVAALLAACDLSTSVRNSARLEVAIRPETAGTLISSAAKTATVTLTGIGVGAPPPFIATSNVQGDSAVVRFDLKLPGAGGNFVMKAALANAAGDTTFRYPAPGDTDVPFGLLNGSDVRVVAFVVRVP